MIHEGILLLLLLRRLQPCPGKKNNYIYVLSLSPPSIIDFFFVQTTLLPGKGDESIRLLATWIAPTSPISLFLQGHDLIWLLHTMRTRFVASRLPSHIIT